MSGKKPLMLEVGSTYEAADFDYFEYAGSKLTGSKAILRLHMKNGTIIDLPTSDDNLKHLLATLVAAFGDHAIKVLKGHNWI